MPNKTIYIPEGEQDMFQQAQTLSGQSLSNTIVTAVRQFVDELRGNSRSAKWITIEVGETVFQKKRFRGVALGSADIVVKNKQRHVTVFGAKGSNDFRGHNAKESVDDSAYLVEHFEVYRTEKGNFAVHKTMVPGPKTLQPNRKTLDVCRDMAALKKLVPEELYQLLLNNQEQNQVEDLDI